MTEAQLLDSIVIHPNGCWTTTYRARRTGYAVGKIGGRVVGLHRYLYERFVGVWPDDLHHRCNNKECLNFGHIDPVSRAVHLVIHEVHRKPQPLCGRGHALVKVGKRRVCRECRNESNRRWRASH